MIRSVLFFASCAAFLAAFVFLGVPTLILAWVCVLVGICGVVYLP